MVAQNEVGGKDLLLKVGKAKTFTTDGITSAITMTAHGLAVGDPLTFEADQLGTITTIDPDKVYFVKTVSDANTIVIALSPTGVAIVPDHVVTSKTAKAYLNVGGIRSKSISFASEGVDITNQDSDEWTKFLDAAGVRSLSISGSGVYTSNANYQYVEDQAVLNNLIELMFIDVKNYKVTWSYFKVTAVENSGDYNAEGNFSISASSASEVKRFTVA